MGIVIAPLVPTYQMGPWPLLVYPDADELLINDYLGIVAAAKNAGTPVPAPVVPASYKLENPFFTQDCVYKPQTITLLANIYAITSWKA